MWPLFNTLLTFVKWYFYFYGWYFLLIVVLSIFHVKLGVSAEFVKLLSKAFKFIEKTKKKHPDSELFEETPHVPIISSEVDSKLYSASVLQNGNIPNYSSTIKRDIILLPEPRGDLKIPLTDENDDELLFSKIPESIYNLSDILPYIKVGIEAIVEDHITSRFESEVLENWNLLTRKNSHLCFYNWKILLFWLAGILLRYLVIFPVRFLNCFTSVALLIVSMAVVGYIPECTFKKIFYRRVNLMCFNVLSRWLGCVLTFHNPENRPRRGIAVSNHTTPFDVLMLNTDNCYSLTGQRQKGFIGILERALSRASPHIWFERAVTADRGVVARRLREHVVNPRNPPILIFPEGTCINNTAVTQFKKGAFEVGATVYPIAIKYDARYGDAFWNSGKQSGFQHVIEMITSWAIKGDIYYLPPMQRKPDETSVQFANRVKAEIAKKLNVPDLSWDGGIKRSKPKPEWKALHQQLFREKLKIRLRNYAQ